MTKYYNIIFREQILRQNTNLRQQILIHYYVTHTTLIISVLIHNILTTKNEEQAK